VTPPRRRHTTRGVIHCAATDPHWHGPVDIETIRRWHVEERGWLDVGYHVYIRRNGVIEIGRDFGASGAHAAGYNADSFAICLEGGARAVRDDQGRFVRLEGVNNFLPIQFEALRVMMLSAMIKYPELDHWVGHRDLPNANTFCPSFDVEEWVRQEFPDGPREELRAYYGSDQQLDLFGD